MCASAHYPRSKDVKQIWTLGDIARQLAVPQHRIVYVINSRGIEPIGRVGNLRVFGPSAVDAVGEELSRIDERRKQVVRDAE
jgi:hypothetical protein